MDIRTRRKRRRDTSTGWIPTKRNLSNLSYSISTNRPAKVRKLLERQTFTIVSFDHGLSSLLLLSCEVGNMEVFEDLFNLSLPLFSIDHVYSYRVTCFPLSQSSEEQATSKEITIVENLDLNTCRTNTLLHIAAENCHLNIVKFLVQQGATVDALNCCGFTPLMVGVRSEEVTKYLIDVGADVNHRDKDGYSALMLAVVYDTHISTFKLLLDAGAQAYVSDVYGNSLLSLIMSYEYSSGLCFLKELMSRGVHPDCDVHGQLQFAGFPLLLNRSKSQVIEVLCDAERPFISQMQRLSINYQTLLNYSPPEPFRKHLAELLAVKAESGTDFEHPAPILAYRNRKEVQSPEELSQLMLSPNSSVELVYQWLLIAERLTGSITYDMLSSYTITYNLTNDWPMKDCLPVFLRFSEIILHHLNRIRFSVGIGEVIRKLLTHYTLLMKRIGSIRFNLIDKKLSEHEIKQLNLILSNLSQAVEQYQNTLSQQHIHGPKLTGLVITISEPRHLRYRWMSEITDVFSAIHKFGSSFIQLKVIEGLFHAFKYMPTLKLFHAVNTSILIESLHRGHDFSFILFLFEIGTEELVNLHSPAWQYPIHIAIDNKDSQIVSLLLQHGAHPDVVNSRGLDPIHSTDDSHMINLLLQHYPLPLCCLAASTIVNSKIPYKEMNLPRHIKKFINLHDWIKMEFDYC